MYSYRLVRSLGRRHCRCDRLVNLALLTDFPTLFSPLPPSPPLPRGHRSDAARNGRVLFEFHEFHESFRLESLKESMSLYLPLLVTIEESGWKDEKFCRIRTPRSLSKRNLSTQRGNEEFHWTNIICMSKPGSRSFLSVDDFTETIVKENFYRNF